MDKSLENKIMEGVAMDITIGMEVLNGPTVYPYDVEVIEGGKKVRVTLDVYIVEGDDYYGICAY